MRRRALEVMAVCGGLAAGGLAFAQEAPLLEPAPEQAFSPAPELQAAPPAPERFVQSPPPGGGESLQLVSAPVATNEIWMAPVDLSDVSTPLYKRWLQSLFDLVAPGEPYRRDKALFVLGTSIGYDNNVLYSATNSISSATYGVNGSVDYRVGTRRLQLQARLNGSVNYYENRPGGSSDQNYALTLAFDYKLMPRLSISGDTYTAYLSQPSPQFVGGTFAYTGSYFYTNSALDLNYQIRPRLGLTMGYAISGFKYEDEIINEQSGFFQQNFSLSGNWLFSPRTTLILQYRYNPVSYYETNLGSTGQFLLVGIQQAISPRFNYMLLFGAEHRRLENPNPDSVSSYLGPFAEGSLTYLFAPRSTLEGRLRLGTEPAGVTGVTIRQTFRSSLGVEHLIGSRLTLGANLAFERSLYDQQNVADYTQDIYSATISLRYQFALYFSVVLRDDYLVVESSLPDSSYTRNYISLGLEATF